MRKKEGEGEGVRKKEGEGEGVRGEEGEEVKEEGGEWELRKVIQNEEGEGQGILSYLFIHFLDPAWKHHNVSVP